MALSKPTRIALMVWAISHMILGIMMIRQSIATHIPFARADAAWWKAYSAGDVNGMYKALDEEKIAMCASWFSSRKDCP